MINLSPCINLFQLQAYHLARAVCLKCCTFWQEGWNKGTHNGPRNGAKCTQGKWGDTAKPFRPKKANVCRTIVYNLQMCWLLGMNWSLVSIHWGWEKCLENWFIQCLKGIRKYSYQLGRRKRICEHNGGVTKEGPWMVSGESKGTLASVGEGVIGVRG